MACDDPCSRAQEKLQCHALVVSDLIFTSCKILALQVNVTVLQNCTFLYSALLRQCVLSKFYASSWWNILHAFQRIYYASVVKLPPPPPNDRKPLSRRCCCGLMFIVASADITVLSWNVLFYLHLQELGNLGVNLY